MNVIFRAIATVNVMTEPMNVRATHAWSHDVCERQNLTFTEIVMLFNVHRNSGIQAAVLKPISVQQTLNTIVPTYFGNEVKKAYCDVYRIPRTTFRVLLEHHDKSNRGNFDKLQKSFCDQNTSQTHYQTKPFCRSCKRSAG